MTASGAHTSDPGATGASTDGVGLGGAPGPRQPAAAPPAAGEALLLLIRHGETEWNAEGRLQGHIDTALSAHGRWQAQRLAEALKDEPLAAVVSSDLQRAAQTGQPLALARGLPLDLDPRLRERHYGVFEGLTRPEIQARHGEAFAHWHTRDPRFAPDGGETQLVFAARVLAALRSAADRARAAGRPVAVVAHGGVLDVAWRAATGLPWEAPRQHPLLNASINRIAVGLAAGEPVLRVWRWGEVDHLAESDDDILAR